MSVTDWPIKTMTDLCFNPQRPLKMHIDLNSCFATIEQQANPLIRGVPVAVSAYDSPGACIVAPSIEAKKLGIKVGMRVFEAREIEPKITVLTPDPDKYRYVHLKLEKIISRYSANYRAQSIDEFSISFEKHFMDKKILQIALEIKQAIRKEIGEIITVSVGISTNRYLAKLASGLNKPDGLNIIDGKNYLKVYKNLKLTDLPWIKERNALRLNKIGVYSVLDFLAKDIQNLKAAFLSALSRYWYLRLRGWEIDEIFYSRKSFGNSYSLSKPTSNIAELAPLLAKLVQKMSFRLRKAGFTAGGFGLFLRFKDRSVWHKTKKIGRNIFESKEIYDVFYFMLTSFDINQKVSEMAAVSFHLNPKNNLQLEMFENAEKKNKLTEAIDKINDNWGKFCIYPARMINTKDKIIDRVAFGGVRELEEMVLTSTAPKIDRDFF